MRLLEVKRNIIVVYGGGFQPFHQGHMSSYEQAKAAFPNAKFFVAASNDTKTRPIPFEAKKFLAEQAGVTDPIIQVKQPVMPREILEGFDPELDILVLVRSERDPMAYTKKDGSPGYYQPWAGEKSAQAFGKNGYIFVTKKHDFHAAGQTVYSGSQVRQMYADADDAGKDSIIHDLYPHATQPEKIKQLFDQYLGGVKEDISEEDTVNILDKAAVDFYKNNVGTIAPGEVDDYAKQANDLLKKADSNIKSKVLDILKKGQDNPYLQGGIITTIGSVLAGGVISTGQKYGLSPGQTNIILQAILNTVIPTLVSRINGRNWVETIKYTLSSALTGTGIAVAQRMGEAVEPDPEGYDKNLLQFPRYTVVVDTPGDLDWYKIGQHYPNLSIEDPHEYGQSDSDMTITVANKEELESLLTNLKRLGFKTKVIGKPGPGPYHQPEIHSE